MKTNHSNNRPLVIFFLLSYLLAWSFMGLIIAQNHGWVSPDIPFTAYALLVMSSIVLITRAYNNSRGSMVIATIFHLTMNIAMNIIEIKAFIVYVLLIFAFTVIVVFLYGPSRLSKAAELPIDKETIDWLA